MSMLARFATLGGAVVDNNVVFSATARNGTGAPANVVNSVNLQNYGGLVITKARSATTSWRFIDTARGAAVSLDSPSAAGNLTESTGLTAFNSDGYTLGADTDYNESTGPVTYIDYTFRKATNVFDIVTYTGNGTNQGVSHSLGVTPELIIVKPYSATGEWAVWHSAFESTGYIWLNYTNMKGAGSTMWNSTLPSSTVFRVGNSSTNANTVSHIAYLFATKAGVSKVGSYTGNGSSQTINCGFSAGARFVLIKRTDTAGDWYVWDTARGIVAANDPHLSPNTTAAEVTTDDSIDQNATGFIVNQVAATNINVNSATYIYLAFA